MPIHSLDPYAVGRIESLNMPDDNKAKAMLQKVAHQGLNVGGGGGGTREICLRLRPASSPNSFLPYESVLSTMLHELSHNIHGPHAAPFYKLLDELTAECEELMAKGIGGSGAGFDAPSAGKLGGRNAGRELSSFDRRQAALKAAEERAKRQVIMPVGPRRVGGDGAWRDLPPAIAAAVAAERRRRDNTWCPTELLTQEAAEHPGTSIDAALQAVLDGRFAPYRQAENLKKVETSQGIPQTNKQAEQQQREVVPRRDQGHMQLPQGQASSSGLKKEIAIVGEKNGINITGGGGERPNVSRGDVSISTAAAGLGRKRSRDDVMDVIDLTDDGLENKVNHLLDAPVNHASGGGGGFWNGTRPSEGGTLNAGGEWTCPACTYLNLKPLTLQCEMCWTTRPGPGVS